MSRHKPKIMPPPKVGALYCVRTGKKVIIDGKSYELLELKRDIGWNYFKEPKYKNTTTRDDILRDRAWEERHGSSQTG